MTKNTTSHTLCYEGCTNFRTRIVLSILSGKVVKITKIRPKSEETGILEFEASFLRLVDKLTNGSRVDVSVTGTAVTFVPGLLTGGTVEHQCCPDRSIGYYLLPLLMLAPFCKQPLQLLLHGVTNSQTDPSIDQVKQSCLPVLRRFLPLASEQLELSVLRRGMLPSAGGTVRLTCPVQKKLRPIQWLDAGRVKRVRGVAYAVHVSPVMSHRIVDVVKSQLRDLLADVHIFTDHYRGDMAGKSPGFGVSIYAETTEGVAYSSDVTSQPRGSQAPPSVPEELGEQVVTKLLDEIYRAGCVDSIGQPLVLLFMALGQKDVSKVLLGPLTPFTIDFMRHLRDFFSTVFRIEESSSVSSEHVDHQSGKFVLTCVGSGFTNLNKTVT